MKQGLIIGAAIVLLLGICATLPPKTIVSVASVIVVVGALYFLRRRPEDKQEAARQIGQTFVKELRRSPLIQFSFRALCWGFGLALLYTITLTALGPQATAGWLSTTNTIVREVSDIVPAISHLADELVRRGYDERTDYVANVVAFQWLIESIGGIIAVLACCTEGQTIRRAFLAYTENQARLGKATKLPITVLRWVFLLTMFAVVPLYDRSSVHGRRSFDLGTSGGGLFVYWQLITLWWAITYYLVFRVLAAIEREPQTA